MAKFALPIKLPEKKEKPERKENQSGKLEKVREVTGKVIMVLYHLRKVVLAAPVVYAAIRLANRCARELPETVGLNLQADGTFAIEISRNLAVICPLALTLGCLVMMFCSRKALYPWAISVFTLAVPILLLVSNLALV